MAATPSMVAPSSRSSMPNHVELLRPWRSVLQAFTARSIAVAVAGAVGLRTAVSACGHLNGRLLLDDVGKVVQLDPDIGRGGAQREAIEARVRSLEITRGDGPWRFHPRPGSAP